MCNVFGVCKVIIDEGRDFLTCSIFDLVNECFVKHWQTPVLDKSEYPIMNTLNSVKFSNNKLWVVPSKGIVGESLLRNEFISVIENDYIKVL